MAEPDPSIEPAQPTVIGTPTIQPYYEQRCNPCLCMHIDNGAKNVAGIEIALHVMYLIGIIAATIITLLEEKQLDIVFLVYASINFLVTFVDLILGIFLYIGVKQRSRWQCCVYFIGRSITQIILIIILFVYATQEAKKIPLAKDYYTIIALLTIIICIGMYFLLIVYYFMESLVFDPTRPMYLVSNQGFQVIRTFPYDAGVGSAPATGEL